MMIHTPLTMTKEGVIAGGQPGDYPDYHQRTSNNQYQGTNNEFKLPTRKEKESILLRYAKKLGLNDRGCYLAVGLSLITFLLLVVIIIMAACWPGEYRKKNSRHQGAKGERTSVFFWDFFVLTLHYPGCEMVLVMTPPHPQISQNEATGACDVSKQDFLGMPNLSRLFAGG